MKTASGLALIAVGAIFAFAINVTPPGFNLHVVGWVLMLTGAAGLILSRRAQGWLRRRTVTRRRQGEPTSQIQEVEIEAEPYTSSDSSSV